MPNEIPTVDCRSAMQQLWDYVDAELTPERMVAIQHHLTECAHCLPHAEFAALRSMSTSEKMPETSEFRPTAGS